LSQLSRIALIDLRQVQALKVFFVTKHDDGPSTSGQGIKTLVHVRTIFLGPVVESFRGVNSIELHDFSRRAQLNEVLLTGDDSREALVIEEFRIDAWSAQQRPGAVKNLVSIAKLGEYCSDRHLSSF